LQYDLLWVGSQSKVIYLCDSDDKMIKIILIALIGGFFSIAILEIDVFNYDNTFFDTYDSYIKIDNGVTLPVIQVKSIKLAAKIYPSFTLCDIKLPRIFNDRRLLLQPYKRKLFLVKSSLLI
jgi:hypothetical protein